MKTVPLLSCIVESILIVLTLLKMENASEDSVPCVYLRTTTGNYHKNNVTIPQNHNA